MNLMGSFIILSYVAIAQFWYRGENSNQEWRHLWDTALKESWPIALKKQKQKQ